MEDLVPTGGNRGEWGNGTVYPIKRDPIADPIAVSMADDGLHVGVPDGRAHVHFHVHGEFGRHAHEHTHLSDPSHAHSSLTR